MNRREFIAGTGTLAAMVATATSTVTAHGSDNTAAPAASHLAELATATFDCLKTGEDCLRHCTESLAVGDQSMAACNRTVHDMLAVCEAMSKVATYHTAQAQHTRKLAEVCADICLDCSAACKPHAHHHVTCKRCMESCDACAKACQQVAAAA